jgi:hypothetical protein
MEPTFHRKQRLVESNPLLLRTEADSALAGLILEYAGDDHVSESLLLHRSLLKRCREIGVRDAFLELRVTLGEPPLAETYEPSPTQALVDTIGEFITQDDWQAARQWLDQHPELLSKEADDAFEALIRTHTARNQPAVVRALIIHRDLLRTCREIGVDAAFERMLNPPATLDLIAENTIAVLTDREEERDNWAETVRLSRVRAAELDDQPMLDLLRAISRLLLGDPPDTIAVKLDGEHAACWQRILDATSSAAQ